MANKTIDFIFSQNKDDHIEYLKNEYMYAHKLWYETSSSPGIDVYWKNVEKAQDELVKVIGNVEFGQFHRQLKMFARRNYNWGD